jgi:hypothetical protein
MFGSSPDCPKWDISEASNGETALRLVGSKSFDLIFMDQYMASIEKQLLGTDTVCSTANGVDCTICGLSANDKAAEFLEAGADIHVQPFPCGKEGLSTDTSFLEGKKKGRLSLRAPELGPSTTFS